MSIEIVGVICFLAGAVTGWLCTMGYYRSTEPRMITEDECRGNGRPDQMRRLHDGGA